MLEHIPAWLGKALTGVRAGVDQLAIVELGGSVADTLATLDLSSPAFAHDARMPARFTADGEGRSPPLVWTAPPAGTQHLVLIVEDPDAPAPQPLVHAIVWGMAPDAGQLAEDEIDADADATTVVPTAAVDIGRNSYLRKGWLPPDPPSGHGEHRYVFQIFAVAAGAGDPGDTPGRSAVIEAITGRILAAGVLVGTYSRDEAAPVGLVGAIAVA